MKEILVLGTGMVGSIIAADLSGSFNVTSADIDMERLAKIKSLYPVSIVKLNFLDKKSLIQACEKYDVVVNAVPGFMGYEVLESIIDAGKNVVDISFFERDPFDLNNKAESRNITAVVDCGIAPGLSNIVLGHHYVSGRIKEYRCYVGGLPFERVYPFQYKAPFSPSDVIEEYTRPARIKENDRIIIRPALSDPELLEFSMGKLEAFNSDGLRTLLRTLDIPDMSEKTLRYPGHLDAVKLLRDAGFFSREELVINEGKIRPIDLTSRLLFDSWKLGDDEDEFTVLRMKIVKEYGETLTYDLFDVRDKETGFSSMGRTTGFTCTAVVNLMAEGKISHKGICPPEYIGMDQDNFNYILNYLSERNISLTYSIAR